MAGTPLTDEQKALKVGDLCRFEQFPGGSTYDIVEVQGNHLKIRYTKASNNIQDSWWSRMLLIKADPDK